MAGDSNDHLGEQSGLPHVNGSGNGTIPLASDATPPGQAARRVAGRNPDAKRRVDVGGNDKPRPRPVDIIAQLNDVAKAGGVLPPCDARLECEYPMVWDLLTRNQRPDGTIRVPSSLRIIRVSGGFRITLEDHESELRKSVCSLTWDGLLDALERAVVDQSIPWEDFQSYAREAAEKRNRRRKVDKKD